MMRGCVFRGNAGLRLLIIALVAILLLALAAFFSPAARERLGGGFTEIGLFADCGPRELPPVYCANPANCPRGTYCSARMGCNCVSPVCGNGELEPGEECEEDAAG